MARQLHLDEDTLDVMELMRRHGLKMSVEFYLQMCKKEFAGVSDRMLQELHGKAYEEVKKNKKLVALRMNPESKKPSPEMPDGDETFRLLAMGHREPQEWKTGPQDAPVKGDATFRQLIGAGTEGPYQQLRANVAGQQCMNPESRTPRQKINA